MVLAELTLARLVPGDICEWRDRMLNKVAPATVLKRMNLLSSIIKHARGEWRIPMKENPATADNARRPAYADVKRTRRLDEAPAAEVAAALARGDDAPLDEEARLLAAVAGSCCPADLLMVRFAIAQATRCGEATGLRWRDVDIEGRVLTLHGRHRRGTKTNDLRVRPPEERPLMKEAADLLRMMLPKSGQPDPDCEQAWKRGSDSLSVQFRGRQVTLERGGAHGAGRGERGHTSGA